MRKTLVIIVLLGLAAVPMLGQWHRSVGISVTDSISLTSRSGGWGIGANETDVHIAWYDRSFLPSTVRYGHFLIGSPPASLLGGPISSDYGYKPVLSVSDTNIHIDWCADGSLFFREVSGMTMGPILEHGWPGKSNLCPAIADDASGNTHCVFNYHDEPRGYCLAYQRRPAGGDFSQPVEIIGPPSGSYANLPYYPTICISPDNNIHAAWVQPWKGNIGYGTSADGLNWTVSEIPNTQCNDTIAPSICCNKWGGIAVIYIDRKDSVRVTYKMDGTWSNPVHVYAGDVICGGPSMCADTSGIFGTVWGAWHAMKKYENSSDEIYCTTNLSSVPYLGIAPITSFDSYNSQYPNVTTDLNGNTHLIWTDIRNGNYDIYYNWRLGYGQRQGRDLAVTCIYTPAGRVMNNTEIFPSARIGNFGEATDSFYANCKMTGPGTNYSYNSDTIYISSGADHRVYFWPWTPSGNAGERYDIKVTVYPIPYGCDDNLGNNVFVDSFFIRGVAVTATTILAPQEGDTLEHLRPAAYFTNTGTDTASNFYCHCDIASTGFQGGNYADSVLVAYKLGVRDSVFIEFDDYECEKNCSYVATFHATSATPDTIYSPHIQVHFYGPYTGVAEQDEVLRIELAGANPFGKPPSISYSIGVPTEVSIRVYDVSGKLVKILHEGELSGKGTLHWNGRDQQGRMLASGLYFVRILTPQFERTHKIVLMR